MKLTHIAIALSLLITSCQTTPNKNHQTEKRDKKAYLTREYAEFRKSLIGQVEYHLDVAVNPMLEHFTGTSKIKFELSQLKDISVDFVGGEVTRLVINGQSIIKPNYNGYFVFIPASMMVIGANEVIIDYKSPFSKEGMGLHKFQDPVDGKYYFHTQFEPYDANRFFPCFDQPDLKARYQMSVLVPESFEVITYAKETKVEKRDGGYKHWSFPKSDLFSTYIMSLHTGEYTYVSDVYKGPYGTYPLRVFVRKSLKQYLRPQDWFLFTKQGFKYFEDFFGIPYPYKKYDQVLAPEFNAGAMENVAAVTFSERFLKRGKVTEKDREGLAWTLLHELAHMWFGNLVTMKWWNDLWLNESFATYMSTKAMAEGTEFKSMWTTFYTNVKTDAFEEDKLRTTHPIEGIVNNTDDAFASFDGITYDKGASVLKQLNFLLGDQNFKKGLQNYFQKYREKNTTLVDFMTSLSEPSKLDLLTWQKEWLQTQRPNTVKAQFTCRAGQIVDFKLLQNAPGDGNVLRTHRTKIGLWRIENKSVRRLDSIEVTYSGAETHVKSLTGKRCPDIVMPNDGDFDYAQIILDEVTSQNLKTYLPQLQPALARAMFFDVLWDMMIFAELGLQDFASVALNVLKTENDLMLLRPITSALGSDYDNVSSVYNALLYRRDWQETRKTLFPQIEQALWSRLQNASSGSDEAYLFFDMFIRTAIANDKRDLMVGWLEGKNLPSGIKLDADRRWTIIEQLAKLGDNRATSLMSREATADTTDWGKKGLLRAQSAIWDKANKQTQFQRLIEDTQLSLQDKRAIMNTLYRQHQIHNKRDIADQFYRFMDRTHDSKDNEFLSHFAERLMPLTCEADLNARAKKYIEKTSHPYAIKRELIIKHEWDERCLNLRL